MEQLSSRLVNGQPMQGLCLEGICERRGCPAYKQPVIMNQGFTSFDLIEDGHSCSCPSCSSAVVPTTCAFNSCQWKWVGKKIDSHTRRPVVVHSDAWSLQTMPITALMKTQVGLSTGFVFKSQQSRPNRIFRMSHRLHVLCA